MMYNLRQAGLTSLHLSFLFCKAEIIEVPHQMIVPISGSIVLTPWSSATLTTAQVQFHSFFAMTLWVRCLNFLLSSGERLRPWIVNDLSKGTKMDNALRATMDRRIFIFDFLSTISHLVQRSWSKASCTWMQENRWEEAWSSPSGQQRGA